MASKLKVILSMTIANELVDKGFLIKKVKPSTRYRGKAAFLFEKTPELSRVLTEIEKDRGIKL